MAADRVYRAGDSVEDYCRAILAALEKGESGKVYNVGAATRAGIWK